MITFLQRVALVLLGGFFSKIISFFYQLNLKFESVREINVLVFKAERFCNADMFKFYIKKTLHYSLGLRALNDL
jgi:hypothetical protein